MHISQNKCMNFPTPPPSIRRPNDSLVYERFLIFRTLLGLSDIPHSFPCDKYPQLAFQTLP